MKNSKRTLCVDIGGSRTKAIVVDERGQPLTERVRLDTPRPALPEAVLSVIAQLAGQCGKFDRVAVGFPGVVQGGIVKTAPNLDPAWGGFNLEDKLGENAAISLQVGIPVFRSKILIFQDFLYNLRKK